MGFFDSQIKMEAILRDVTQFLWCLIHNTFFIKSEWGEMSVCVNTVLSRYKNACKRSNTSLGFSSMYFLTAYMAFWGFSHL